MGPPVVSTGGSRGSVTGGRHHEQDPVHPAREHGTVRTAAHQHAPPASRLTHVCAGCPVCRYDDDPELGFEGGVRVRPPSAPETGRRSTGPPAQPVKPKELLATSSSASLHMMLNGKHRSRSFNRLAVDMDPSGVAGSADSSHMMVGVAADVEHPSVDDEDAPDLDTIDFRGGTGDTSSESEDECLEMLDSGVWGWSGAGNRCRRELGCTGRFEVAG